MDSSGNLYIADSNNCAIRKITASTSVITTIAGGLGCNYSGDDGPAINSQLRQPQSVSLDGAGNIYIGDQNNQRIREIVAQTGDIVTVAGDGVAGYNGDGAAAGIEWNYPDGVFADPNWNLFISDEGNQILRWVTPTGQAITFAGTVPGSSIPSNGFSGDGGPALKAQFYNPTRLSQDSQGYIYVADQFNNRIRRVTPFAGYGLSSANLSFGPQAAGTASDFQAITVSAIGPTTIDTVTASAGYSEIDNCAGAQLTVWQTCEIDVYFQPTAAGKIEGTISIASNAFFATNPSKVSLAGTGEGLTLSGPLAFGAQPLKSTTSSTFTLSNSGSAVSLKKIYLSPATVFTIVTGTGGGTCPTASGSLASGASCTIIVAFAPVAVGSDKSTLVVESNDPASPLLSRLTGVGTEVKTLASSIAFGTISYARRRPPTSPLATPERRRSRCRRQ